MSNKKQTTQLLMLSVMSQAFSELSDQVADLIASQNEEEFEADPYGTAMRIMQTGFDNFKTTFKEIEEGTRNSDVGNYKVITINSQEELEAFLESGLLDESDDDDNTGGRGNGELQ